MNNVEHPQHYQLSINLETLKILDEYTKTFNELENEMYRCMQLKKAYQFNILVDEQNGF